MKGLSVMDELLYVVELEVLPTCVGGCGGGPVGGGGDFMAPLPLRALIRDEIDDVDMDEEEVVLFEAKEADGLMEAPLSKGLTRSCGSKLVTGLYGSLPSTLLLELKLPAVNVEVDEVSERASIGFSLEALAEGCCDIISAAGAAAVLPAANENCLPKKELPGIPATPPTTPAALLPPPPLSLAVRLRFLLANSYMSPNIPANVFLKFFMVSSASSTTEL